MLPDPSTWLDLEAVAADIGKSLVQVASAVSPVRTGKLKAGWGYSVADGGRVVSLTNPVGYAEFHPKVAAEAVARTDVRGIVAAHIQRSRGR